MNEQHTNRVDVPALGPGRYVQISLETLADLERQAMGANPTEHDRANWWPRLVGPLEALSPSALLAFYKTAFFEENGQPVADPVNALDASGLNHETLAGHALDALCLAKAGRTYEQEIARLDAEGDE